MNPDIIELIYRIEAHMKKHLLMDFREWDAIKFKFVEELERKEKEGAVHG